MQSYVIAAICSGFAALGSGLVLWLVSMSSKDRDKRLGDIESAILRLVEKVGAQNGRVGKLEEWKEMREKIHPSQFEEPKPRRRRK